jgi:hypothetical protein
MEKRSRKDMRKTVRNLRRIGMELAQANFERAETSIGFY